MKFKIEDTVSRAREFEFIYRPDEYSIDFVGDNEASFGGVLINDLAFEINKLGEVIFLSGLCPHNRWIYRLLEPPIGRDGRLLIENGSSLTRGVYHRVNDDRDWPVYVDPTNKTLCIGNPESEGKPCSFLPGATIVLEASGPSALWFPRLRGIGSVLAKGQVGQVEGSSSSVNATVFGDDVKPTQN